MENNQTQFLESILSQIQSLKEQIENLESLVAGHMPATTLEEDLPEETVPETVPEAPVFAEDVQSETVPEAPVFAEDVQSETVPETPVLAEEVQFETVPETPVLAEELQSETVPAAPVPTGAVQEEESLPVFGLEVDDAIEVVPIGEARHAGGAVMDRMAEKESWRTDMPGSSVNDIRSAISLNDRILFINTLFHEDPVAFKEALSSLNAMPSFDEGVKFVMERHPEWNTGSDVVYRFMMAVRRKLK